MARTAVVHEWVSAYAGAEQVFEQMAQAWPRADLYALSRSPEVQLDVGGRPITTTLLDQPWLRDRRAATLALMPLAWRLLGERGYDLVITSHHAFASSHRLARGRGGDGVHLAYVHSPARYVWSPELDSRGAVPLLAPVRKALQGVDQGAAAALTGVAANSTAVARRVQDFWRRDARVIFPPVDVDFYGRAPGAEEPVVPGLGPYLLSVGRFIPYKNHHVVIDLAERAGLPAVLAGAGPLLHELQRRAARSSTRVVVLEAPTKAQLRQLYRGALVLVFPAVDDFGIVPVEAQATGTPVVAPARGGALDTVVDGITGRLVDRLEPGALLEALRDCKDIDPLACVENAQRFSRQVFTDELHSWADETVGGRR